MPYEGYTEKRKETNKRHMDKLKRVVIWCYPEEKARIEQKAQAAGMTVNAYCKEILLNQDANEKTREKERKNEKTEENT